MLLLSGVGAVGTFLPPRQDVEVYEKTLGPVAVKIMQFLGFADFFHSMWFRVLLLSLVFNLVACVIVRIPAAVSAIRGDAALRREPVLVLDAAGENLDRIKELVKSLGLRERSGNGYLYSRGAVGYVMTLLTHGSLVIIMVSSLFGSIFGVIATQRIHIGGGSSTAFNWKTGQDMRLPFEVLPVDLV